MTATQTPRQFALMRNPQNDDELYWWIRAVFGITIPRTPVCPHHCTPFEAFSDAFFARSVNSVWKASRGLGGKTQLLGTLGLAEAVILNAQVSILGGSGAQSLRVHEATDQAWKSPHAPKHLLIGDPTRYMTKFVTDAWIETLMASQRSVRGTHPQRLRLDEIDEMELEILNASLGTVMKGRRGRQKGVQTHVVMSSTHQYPDKTMSAMIERAEEKGWPIFEWCYRETMNPIDGWLTPDEVERKKAEVPKAMWDAEYDLQEPSFEGRAIDPDAVDACFDPNIGETDEDHWVSGIKSTHALHVTGVDWAKERDLTVVATFDPMYVEGLWVCREWQSFNRLPWPIQVNKAERQYRRWPGFFAHDATGIGNVISDFFDTDLKRKNKTRWEDITLGGATRTTIFSDYIAAIEDHQIRYPRISRAYREHKYVTMKDLFGPGHPPDSFVSGAIAWAQRHRLGKKGIVLPTGLTRAKNPWDLSQ